MSSQQGPRGKPTAGGSGIPKSGGKCVPPKPGGAGGKPPKTAKQKAAEKEAFPAFSLPMRPPASMLEQFKEKQKIIRRNKPVGEDINKLKDIVKSVREKPTTVHEFSALVSPSTGDNGELLRRILAEEITLFQTTTRNIYETMTQDMSDVLINEQIQLKEFAVERHTLYNEKMQRMLTEILDYCPEFSFDLFFTKEGYVDEMFPLEELDTDDEVLEALLRQEAFHRYEWLKSEGGRLKDENSRLQKRLNELKKRQKEELREVFQKEQRAEQIRKALEAKQEDLEERLEELNESLSKSLVESELAQAKPISLQPLPPKPKLKEQLKKRRFGAKPRWAEQQAAEIEASHASEGIISETAKLLNRSKASSSRTGMRAKQKRAGAAGVCSAKKTSMFNTTPKTPPTKEAESQEKSPFHYSPPKTPPGAGMDAPGGFDEDLNAYRMKINTSHIVTEQLPDIFSIGGAQRRDRSSSPQSGGRRQGEQPLSHSTQRGTCGDPQ